MAFKTNPLHETAEAEVQRLIREGREELAALPVNVHVVRQDVPVELPWAQLYDRQCRVVVVPVKFHEPVTSDECLDALREKLAGSRLRHTGSWECIVVASDDPTYQVGGWRITVPTAELARGKHVTL